MTEQELLNWTKDYLNCDSVRISKPLDRLFLIIGYKRKSVNQWFNYKREPVNFDYLEESSIASGSTIEDLEKGVKKYKRLQKMNMAEYLEVLKTEPDLEI